MWTTEILSKRLDARHWNIDPTLIIPFALLTVVITAYDVTMAAVVVVVIVIVVADG